MNDAGIWLIALGIAVAMLVHSGVGLLMVLVGALLLILPALRVGR